MAVRSLTRSSIESTVQKYSNFLVGNAAYSPSSDFLIEEQLLSSTASTVTFSNIPQTYKHLQIRITARATSTSSQFFYTRMNGDTGSNYSLHGMYGSQSTSVSAYAFSSQDLASYYGGRTGSSAGGYTTTYSTHIMDILDYTQTTKNTTLRLLNGLIDNPSSGERTVGLHSGAWLNTAAVTSVSFIISAGSFDTGSRFSLYGSNG